MIYYFHRLYSAKLKLLRQNCLIRYFYLERLMEFFDDIISLACILLIVAWLQIANYLKELCGLKHGIFDRITLHIVYGAKIWKRLIDTSVIDCFK